MMDTGVCTLPCSPICLADAMALAGAAPRWDAASLLLVPVSVRVITQRFIAGGEGALLRAVSGAAFDPYAAQTRRLLSRGQPSGRYMPESGGFQKK